MREAQAFALANRLGIQDGMPTSLTGLSSSASVESKRETAQNQVNALAQLLTTAKSLGDRNVFQAPQIEANASLYSELQTLEARLLEKQTLLKPSDDLIRQLKRRRQNLIAYINQRPLIYWKVSL